MNDYEVLMSVGIHDHEKTEPQRVIISISAECERDINAGDDISGTVSYDDFKQAIDRLSQQKHYHLLETFAEETANSLLENKAIRSLQVRCVKPDIYNGNPPEVGVTLKRPQNAG